MSTMFVAFLRAGKVTDSTHNIARRNVVFDKDGIYTTTIFLFCDSIVSTTESCPGFCTFFTKLPGYIVGTASLISQ